MVRERGILLLREHARWGQEHLGCIRYEPLVAEDLARAGSAYKWATRVLRTPPPNILLIFGTFSANHLRENLAAAGLELPSHAIGDSEGKR